MKNTNIKNTASVFLNDMKSWEDEEFKIPIEIIKGLKEEMGFSKPSKIQAVAIPMIVTDNFNLIAQSKNGSGKTGAFVIGSAMKVDPSNKEIQVLVLAHTQELVQQIADIYSKVLKYTNIEVINSNLSTKFGQISVMTTGKLKGLGGGGQEPVRGRGKGRGGRGNNFKDNNSSSFELKFPHLKCLVVDEADFFFNEKNNLDEMKDILSQIDAKKVQQLYFSATYPENVKKQLAELVSEASQIQVKTEKLQLDNVVQYEYKCEHRKKIDFLMDIYKDAGMVLTIVFVNTVSFVDTIQHVMKTKGFKVYLLYGGKMSKDERLEIMDLFRRQKINMLITTNLLSRGIDIPAIKLVVNFDVPVHRINDKTIADPETYLHRIGRTGRFGTQGIAITIYDRDEDKRAFDEIIDHYDMKSKVKQLKNPQEVKGLLENLETGNL